MIDPRAAMKLQSELMQGESFQWAAMPNPSVVFHSGDWFMIPFSLLWGGFAIFWEAGALGYWGKSSHPGPSFMVVWGIPFVVVGQYLIWGRFLWDAWLKRRTYYGVTNRRVLIVQEGWTRKTRSCYLESIPELNRDGDRGGSLWLGEKLPLFSRRENPSRGWSSVSVSSPVPVFVDIDEVESVYRLVRDLREQAVQASRRSDAS